jgi:hypothetical protein
MAIFKQLENIDSQVPLCKEKTLHAQKRDCIFIFSMLPMPSVGA